MSLFSKFFKKSKLNQEVLCLVNLQDSIIMPPNSFFDNVKNKELCEEYLGKYPVIFLSLKSVDGLTFEDAKYRMTELIGLEAERFGFLEDTSVRK